MQSAPERIRPLAFLSEQVRAFVGAIDDEPATQRRGAGHDVGPGLACVVGTLALVFMEYTSERAVMRFVYRLWPSLYDPRFAQLAELSVWVGVRIIAFAAFPALAIRWFLRERIVDHGLRVRGLRGHWKGYLVLFALVLPGVVIAASRPEFSRYYPFYRLAGESWCDLLYWELLYALHFVALEFFFRGFWLTACRRSFGSYAVYVAVAPYCMIHFTKPLLEVLAAIPAAIVLGLLAMRARSIWGGALLHVGVAWSMDGLALWHTSGFPTRWLP